MTGPYLGAFKSYIIAAFTTFFPSLAGANYFVNILLASAVLFLTWKVATLFLPAGKSTLAPLLLSSSTGFISMSPEDYGPNLVGSASLLASVYFLISFYRNNQVRSLFFSSFFCGLAIADKQTSIPALFPLILLLILLASKKIRIFKNYLLLTLGIFTPLIPTTIYLAFKGGFQEGRDWTSGAFQPQRLANIKMQFTYLTDGLLDSIWKFDPYYLRAVFGSPFSKMRTGIWNVSVSVVFISCVVALVVVLVKALKERRFAKRIVIPLWVLISIYFVPAFSPRPRHYLIFAPMITISVIILISILLDGYRKNSSSDRIFGLFFAVILAISFFANVYFLSTLYSNKAGGIASPALRDIASEVERYSDLEVLNCLDYSICVPLASILPKNGEFDVRDLAFDTSFTSDSLTSEDICSVLIVGRQYQGGAVDDF